MTTVRVSYASWEIECCQPPPGVEDVVEWALLWHGGADEAASAALPWQATPWTLPDGEGGRGLVLRLGGVTAWYDAATVLEVPDPGWLSVEGHVGVPEPVPSTRGVVRRVRVVRQTYQQIDSRTWAAVSGRYVLRDVQRSPRWFACDLPSTVHGESVQDDGLLIDLEVDENDSLPLL
ncbi:MAG: DUF6578 domain-containing protein [Nocardioidaceae bacterium]